MSKRDAVIALVCIILATAILIIVPTKKGEISPETTATTEIPTEVKTTAKIATERPTEALTEATEKPAETTGKMVFSSEYKIAERVAVTTEEVTHEIDENGYGWVQLQYSAPYNLIENHLTNTSGSIEVFGHRETWRGVDSQSIPGKHTADDGTIRDKDGFIAVASRDLDLYTIVMTSLGPGKVYGYGHNSGVIDIYTNWE